jgi:hypothetical protein
MTFFVDQSYFRENRLKDGNRSNITVNSYSLFLLFISLNAFSYVDVIVGEFNSLGLSRGNNSLSYSISVSV